MGRGLKRGAPRLDAADCRAVAMARRFSFLFILMVQSRGCRAPGRRVGLSGGGDHKQPHEPAALLARPASTQWARSGVQAGAGRQGAQARLRAERDASAGPQRSAGRALARVAGALLRERLLAAAGHLPARQRARRPLTATEAPSVAGSAPPPSGAKAHAPCARSGARAPGSGAQPPSPSPQTLS